VTKRVSAASISSERVTGSRYGDETAVLSPLAVTVKVPSVAGE